MSTVATQGTSKKTVDLDRVDIKPLASEMSRAAFCCGETRIDNFFRNNARDHHARNKVRVYVADYESLPIGYYYLVAVTHNPEMISPEAFEKFGRVKHAPCVYLGMLGVCEECQGNGVGKLLMLHAMRQTLKVADIVGLYALTLEAINEGMAERYEKWGFNRFASGRLEMFIALPTIRMLFSDGG